MNIESHTVIELVVRVTLVLTIGLAIGVALYRQAASAQHLVWSATLGGSLVLAVLVLLAPRLDVPIPHWDTVRQAPTAPMAQVVEAPTIPKRNAEASVNEIIDGAMVRLQTHRRTPMWLIVWASGALFVAGWGLLGRLGLARMARNSTAVPDGPWQTGVHDAATAFGVRRPVRIFVSSSVGAPVTWGVRRPVLFLPAAAMSWSDDVRRSVVAHEVAHIARNDYLHQLVALAACAIYWFHPLSWALVRRVRLTAERACDDMVLANGTAGEEYAAHLIGVARGSRALRLAGAVAIGMARPSTLEGRIMAVLDPTTPRAEPTRRARRLAIMPAALLLGALGSVDPVFAEARSVTNDPIRLPSANVEAPAVVVPPARAPRPELPSSSNSQTTQQQSQEEVVDARPGETLELDLKAGGSVTVRSWDDNRVRVRTQLGGDDWRDVDVRVDRQSSGVLVEARIARSRRSIQSTNNRFDIMVPRRFNIRINSSGGRLAIADVDGRFSGLTAGGGFTLERVSGSASLNTGGGEIRVSDSNLSGHVSTGGGLVMLSRVSGGLRGSSGSGPVIYGESGSGSNETSDLRSVDVEGDGRISIGRNSSYRAGSLVIRKVGGNVDLEAAPNGARVHTGGGYVRVGAAGGDVSATTGGGDVTVGPASGSVSASTGAGQVHIVVDRAARDQVIEASSGKGKVIIELPRDFEGRLELETAHTRTHEGTARIRSDFEIDIEPLTDWDDREGTARRYLRASGRIGRGDARVVVRTVNGEIEIRRR